MADRSFEQQVQVELAELRMKPDATAWLIIESALHKEKKRRWLIWLFVLLGGLGTAGGWAYYSWNDQILHKATGQTKAINRTPESAAGKSDLFSEKPSSGLNKHIPVTNPTSSIKQVLAKNRKELAIANANREAFVLNIDKHSEKIIEGGNTNAATKRKMNAEEITKIAPVAEQPSVSVGANQSLTTKAANESESRKADSNQVSIQLIPLQTLTLSSDASEQDTTSKLVTKKEPSKKWQTNVLFAAGYTSARNGLSGGWTLSNAYNGSLSGSLGGSGQMVAAPEISPSGNPGFSFSIGIEIQKPVTKRLGLGISLGYTMYQTNVLVGRRVDSAMYFANARSYNDNNFYFIRGNAATYREIQHFMNADVNLYVPFTLYRKIPVRWKLGAGVQVMMASNALLYDEGSNIFFRNNALLAKMQPNLSTGFDIALGKQQLFYLGPHMQYTTTGISDRTGNSRNLLFTSVKFSMSLVKKKKPVQR